MTYHRIIDKSNVTGTNSGAGTVHPSGATEFTHGFKQGSCCSYCPISTQIFRNDLLNHCGDYDLMINTLKEMSFKIGYSIFVIRLNKCIRVLKQNDGFKQGSCCSYCPISCLHVFNCVF
jgi:hypothetical protein